MIIPRDKTVIAKAVENRNWHSSGHPTVAVIGGGAAGLSAARTLIAGRANVIIFESSPQLGGNCFGVDVIGADGTNHRVDGGVSDFNRNTFKELRELISELGLQTRPINCDLSVSSKSGQSLLSCIDGEVAVDPEFGCPKELAEEMAAFRVRCEEVLTNASFSTWTIQQYLDHIGASHALRNAFVLPRAMGSFPMPDKAPQYMPIVELVRFWLIHGIVGATPADRHTVVGGMHRYVEALAKALKKDGADIRVNTRVLYVNRLEGGVEICIRTGKAQSTSVRADYVLFATHARDALRLIADDVDEEEASTLARFKIQRARVVVHNDPGLMASERDEWGAFNYVAPDDDWPAVRPTITFYPNRLGSLPDDVPDTFVSMNPFIEPRPETVVSDAVLVHPVAIDGISIANMKKIQGKRRTWWAGSYMMSPYVHESAWISGRIAAEQLLSVSFGARPDEREILSATQILNTAKSRNASNVSLHMSRSPPSRPHREI